jgi:hypothetical protein
LDRQSSLADLARIAKLRELSEVGAVTWLGQWPPPVELIQPTRPFEFGGQTHEVPDVDLELFDIDIDWTGIETVGSLSAIVEEVRAGAKFDKFDTAEVLQRVIERCQQPHAKDQEAERSWISTAYFELTEQMRWAAAGRANMHFRVPLVRQVFERLLEVARLDRSMAGQGDQIVQDLAWIVVPRDLDLTLQQIVELRRNSDAFASWRTELRSALTCVDSLPLANQDWRAAARFQMRESLQPVAQQIDRELARSTFLSKARTGVWGIQRIGAWHIRRPFYGGQTRSGAGLQLNQWHRRRIS